MIFLTILYRAIPALAASSGLFCLASRRNHNMCLGTYVGAHRETVKHRSSME